jgi:hypothetical protein
MSKSSIVSVAALAAVIATLAPTSVARAQWTVTNLHPAASSATANSVAWGLSGGPGGQQVGQWGLTTDRAALWTGSAASHVDLHPAGASSSYAFGVAGGQQVGFAVDASVSWRASLWSGTASSWTDLHPAGASDSIAYATNGSTQVGYGAFSSPSGPLPRAGLWTGTAASWTDLNPTGSIESVAYAVSGSQQGGYAIIGGYHRAGIWSGTASSWVDLSQPTWVYSSVTGMAPGQQVGVATVSGFSHAMMWSGSASSFVDLHPGGIFQNSWATATDGTTQVGWVDVAGVPRAALWNGTAGSFEDLSLALTGFRSSQATGVWSDSTTLYISGYGFSDVTLRNEALIWTRPIPSPGTAALLGLAGLAAARRRR